MKKTIIIAENGIIQNNYRINYLKAHIEAMNNTINDEIDLIGYTPWGVIDIISLGIGEIRKQYGLIYFGK